MLHIVKKVMLVLCIFKSCCFFFFLSFSLLQNLQLLDTQSVTICTGSVHTVTHIRTCPYIHTIILCVMFKSVGVHYVEYFVGITVSLFISCYLCGRTLTSGMFINKKMLMFAINIP